jgi:hypothetical protein
MRHKGSYVMFYGVGDQIALATSRDGKLFQRQLLPNGKVGMFSDGFGTRDPMTIRVGKLFYTYYSANPGTVFNSADASAANRKSLHMMPNADLVRTSPDLKHWSDSKIVAQGGEAGMGPSSAECPFVYSTSRPAIIISSAPNITARMPRPGSIAPKIPPTSASMTTAIWSRPSR